MDVARSGPSEEAHGVARGVASFAGINPKEVPTMATRSSLQIQRAATRLKEVSDRLRAMQSSVAVAVAALRGQNADIDEDVARLLVRTVSDPLQDQIDSIKSALRLLAHSTRDKR
jgi:hypothetical protein